MGLDQIISVVIPTYKNRGLLNKSIDSVLNQSIKTIEILVVDDNEPGSEYRLLTEKVMESYKNVDNVKYIKHEHNKNGAAARNTGIKASKGNFIAFLDDDDEFVADKLEKQLNFLLANPQFSAVYCYVTKNGKWIETKPFEGDVTKELLEMNTFMQTSTLMFRREAIEKLKGFDESFRRHQDYEIMLRFFSLGYKIGCIQERLTIMGVNKGENILSAKKYYELKKHFLKQFDSYITTYDKKYPGFRRIVYSKHFAILFLAFLKEKNIISAIEMMGISVKNSPVTFYKILSNSISKHIK